MELDGIAEPEAQYVQVEPLGGSEIGDEEEHMPHPEIAGHEPDTARGDERPLRHARTVEELQPVAVGVSTPNERLDLTLGGTVRVVVDLDARGLQLPGQRIQRLAVRYLPADVGRSAGIGLVDRQPPAPPVTAQQYRLVIAILVGRDILQAQNLGPVLAPGIQIGGAQTQIP